jgi:branched-chain amino acid transport system ATP-binding protein
MTEPLLAVASLSRHFGGLKAVDRVSLDLLPGELHAVIGPNGAGKSTLINLLSGDLAPSGGAIRFAGRDAAGLPAWRMAQLGIGRSYQRTNIFRELSVIENVRLAAQARHAERLSLLRPAAGARLLVERAREALAEAGLAGVDAARPAAALSHGEQRQLEIAMTLATEPSVLLLDEPLAGMGAEETERMVALLRGLVRGRAILLVEHDMDVVFAVADRLTVMVDGSVLARGTPAEIRASAAVRDAYLGEAS